MLTCVKEGGKSKCDQYWPLEIEEKFTFESSYEISLISVESVMPNLIKRKIKIQSMDGNAEERLVVHLQYMTWPDHGAPDESDNKIISKILDFMREYHLKSKANNHENKITVHCSAGIGRSGTIIAIYNI
jgi:protein tyrosine phosphatase